MRWIVTVHSALGSMAEAGESMFTVLVADKDSAQFIGRQIQHILNETGKDLWATWCPVDTSSDVVSGGEICDQVRRMLTDRFGD